MSKRKSQIAKPHLKDLKLLIKRSFNVLVVILNFDL